MNETRPSIFLMSRNNLCVTTDTVRDNEYLGCFYYNKKKNVKIHVFV